MPVTFRAYRPEDREALLTIFDANCPEFFAPNEREDFEGFLGALEPNARAAMDDAYGYVVVEDAGMVVGAHGVREDAEHQGCRLTWILFAPDAQGRGLGRHVMDRVRKVARRKGATSVGIAASGKSAPFFAKFGAVVEQVTHDGWGPGMDRIDMRLDVAPTPAETA
ncbi:MAG: GNAT family N-acetyltransferase [Cytophagaceae bacterium]|nr:GNAT family N-acetyltransferase [Gemmatimonadaceae bacterium]